MTAMREILLVDLALSSLHPTKRFFVEGQSAPESGALRAVSLRVRFKMRLEPAI